MAKATEDGAWLPAILGHWPLASRVRCWTAAYAISRWLTRPTLGTVQPTPTHRGLAWEPLQCRTDDGFHLAGWLVAPPMPRGTVAIFHSVRQNRSQALNHIEFLVASGYRCVAFDHRGHGESSGKRTSFGYRESRDVLAVLDLVRQRWPVQPRLALGIGMGAAAICFAAPRLHPLAGVVLENLCPDLEEALSRQLESIASPLMWQLGHAVRWFTERRLGVRLAQLAPENHVRFLSPTPILFLGATGDPVAARNLQQFSESYPGRCETGLVPPSAHQAMERVRSFLDRCLGVGFNADWSYGRSG